MGAAEEQQQNQEEEEGKIVEKQQKLEKISPLLAAANENEQQQQPLAMVATFGHKKILSEGSPEIGGNIESTAGVPIDDDFLEIFQFCTFHIVGNKFCLVNRHWSLLAQWHIQNRKRRIPRLILRARKVCLPLIGPTITWQKRGYLCSPPSAAHAHESPIDGDIPLEIPKNIEQIRHLSINLPFDQEHVHGQKFIAFIAACSKHMRKCRIRINWNEIVQLSVTTTTLMPLFRASISQLDELHVEYNQIWAMNQDLQKWLLCRPFDGGNFGNNNKERRNLEENSVDGQRKLVLINITFFQTNLIMGDIKRQFLSSRMLSIPTFSVKFMLGQRAPSLLIDPIYEPIKVKNTRTGQVFMWGYSEPGNMSTILMRCSNSEAESDIKAQFTQTNELNNIIWNLRPGKLYRSPQEIDAAQREKDKKLPPDFVNLLV